jgi:hypothetical protein
MELVKVITQGMLEDYEDGVIGISKEQSNAKYIREVMQVARGTGILQGAPDNLRTADPHELNTIFFELLERIRVIRTIDPLALSPLPTTPEASA